MIQPSGGTVNPIKRRPVGVTDRTLPKWTGAVFTDLESGGILALKERDAVPTMREIQQYEAAQGAAGWHSMGMLVRHVQSGGKPATTAPTIMCRTGEAQYGTLPVDLHIYCGADVEYSSSMYAAGGLLFTAASLAASAAINANNRRKAEAAAAPQWRPSGRFPAIITNQRLLLMTDSWASYHYPHLVMIEPNPMNYAVALHFEGAQPLMLRGPWVPWATVAICATLFGTPWPPGYNPPPPLRAAPQQMPVQPVPHQPSPAIAQHEPLPQLPPGQGG